LLFFLADGSVLNPGKWCVAAGPKTQIEGIAG